MTEFKSGDKVRLKTANVPMTVTKVGPDTATEQMTVWVTWFDSKGNLQQADFPPEVLEVVTNETTVPSVVHRAQPSIVDRASRFFGDRGRR